MVTLCATLEIPQDVLNSSRLTADELRIGLALSLYQQNRLSIGKARELASMSLWQFRQLLASRQIAPHYGPADLEQDMATLQGLE